MSRRLKIFKSAVYFKVVGMVLELPLFCCMFSHWYSVLAWVIAISLIWLELMIKKLQFGMIHKYLPIMSIIGRAL